jgi:hypothetical protein
LLDFADEFLVAEAVQSAENLTEPIAVRRSEIFDNSSERKSAGQKFLTSAAIRVGNELASKWVIMSTSERRDKRLSHVLAASLPKGVIAPMPLTTTHRLIIKSPYINSC